LEPSDWVNANLNQLQYIIPLRHCQPNENVFRFKFTMFFQAGRLDGKAENRYTEIASFDVSFSNVRSFLSARKGTGRMEKKKLVLGMI
jgi:hypothetical protein